MLRAGSALICLLVPLACGAETQTSTRASELTGVLWRLTAIEQAGADTLEPQADHLPTLGFDAETTDGGVRRLSGSGGCNRFSGSYVAAGEGSLSVPGPLAATRMFCPPPIGDLEMVLLQALQAAEAFEIEGDRLRIRFAGGVLHYRAAPSGTDA